AVANAGGEAHLDRAVAAAATRERHAPRRPGERLFERDRQLVVDGGWRGGGSRHRAGPRGLPARATTSPCALCPAEEGLEEVGERARVAEHLLDFVRAQRPASRLPAHVERPGAAARTATTEPGERRLPAALPRGLLVVLPVGAELVVLAACV